MAGIQIIAKDKEGNIKQEHQTSKKSESKSADELKEDEDGR